MPNAALADGRILLLILGLAGCASSGPAAVGSQAAVEKSLLARGFHLSGTNASGERILCRAQVAAGSRIASEEWCGTAQQLEQETRQTQIALREGYAISSPGVAPRDPHQGHPIQSGTDRDLCARGESDAAIMSCTHIIEDSRSTEELRIIALRNRGWLLQAAGDFDRAISDYTAALRLSSEPSAAART